MRCSAKSGRSFRKAPERRATPSTRVFQWHDRDFRLVDTAGFHKKPQAHGAIEYYAALRSLSAIARCDIALLVFDAMTGIMTQDRRLAGIALEERKGLIIVGNKWDLVREQDGDFSQNELAEVVRESVPFAAFAPITFLSAKTHRRLGSLMPIVAGHRGESRPSHSNRAAQCGRFALRFWRTRHRQLRASCCVSITRRSLRRILHSSFSTATIPNSCNRITSVSWRIPSGKHFEFEGVPLTLEFRARRDRDESKP